jgi:hypothetical protein
MSKSNQLTKRQLAVIEDLFTDELDEREVLEKHGVKPDVYRKWLADERFIEHFERRLAQAYHSSRIALARHALAAADRLIQLTKCKQNETARKACLDIIFPQSPSSANHASSADVQGAGEDIHPTSALPPETASRILAILAEPPGSTQDRDEQQH